MTALPSPDGQAVVALDGLSVQFGKRPILRGLAAELRGRAIGLLGPNGAGKTTLIHTLLGFHPPSAGTARVFGLDIRTHAKALRAKIGYMPEGDTLIPHLTGVRFVRLMAELSGLPAEAALERAHQALFYVGLGEARYRKLESYSLGMRQKAKLAQAIVHDPRLLFLDEPTNGLDPPARQRMIELVREIRDTGRVHVIVSSHILRDVEECCDEVLVLKEGRIATYTDLAAERAANRRIYELETRGDEDGRFTTALAALGCELAAHRAGRLKMVLPEAVEVRDVFRLAAERNVQIRRLDPKRDSLEDVFLRAMEEAPSEAAPGRPRTPWSTTDGRA